MTQREPDTAGPTDSLEPGKEGPAVKGLNDEPQGGTGNAALFPLRLLGMGLPFAWDWLMSTGPTGFGSELWPGGTTVNFVFVASQLLTFIVLALGSRCRLSIERTHTRTMEIGAVLSVLGTLAVWLGQYLPTLTAPIQACLLITGGAFCGASCAVLMLGWAEVYSRMTPGSVFAFGSLSLVFCVAAYLFIRQCATALQLASILVIPLSSFAMCSLSATFVGQAETPEQPQARYAFPLKPVLITGTCGFVAAFVDVALFEQGVAPHVAADAALGGIISILAVALHRQIKPVSLVQAGLSCTAAAIASVALFGSAAAFAASFLSMVSYASLTFFTYALLANTCYRTGVPSTWAFGFTMAARLAMDHLGGFARMVCPQLAESATSPLDLAMMAAVGLILIGVTTLVWMSERSFNSAWAIERVDVGLATHQPSDREILLAGCERLAEVHGLTDREAEVLTLLIEGHTYQEVCSELLLSPNTVKTHARHAYGKLGVHTREEAATIARVEGRYTN